MLRPAPHAPRAPWLATVVGIGLLASACVTVSVEPGGPGPAASAAGRTSAPGGPASRASTQAASPSPMDRARPGVRLGYVSLDERVPFARSVSAGVREAAAQAGVELLECDSGLTAHGALGCARILGEAGVGAVISFQGFPELGEEFCAVSGDVPTIGVAFAQGPCEVTRVVIDNAASGRMVGEALGRFARERWDCAISAYVSLESSAAGSDGEARMTGLREGFQRHCQIPAERSWTLDGADRVATARTQVAELLASLPGRRIIVAGLNEDSILGAMAAARSMGRGHDLYYGGQGADPSMRREIACDAQYVASVAHFPERFGAILVPAALRALDGLRVVPRMSGPLRLVTAADIREVYPDIPACEAEPAADRSQSP